MALPCHKLRLWSVLWISIGFLWTHPCFPRFALWQFPSKFPSFSSWKTQGPQGHPPAALLKRLTIGADSTKHRLSNEKCLHCSVALYFWKQKLFNRIVGAKRLSNSLPKVGLFVPCVGVPQSIAGPKLSYAVLLFPSRSKLQPAEVQVQTPSLFWRGIWHRHSFKCCPTRSSSQPLCGMFSMNFRSAKESNGKEKSCQQTKLHPPELKEPLAAAFHKNGFYQGVRMEWNHVGLQVYTLFHLLRTTRWHTSPPFGKPFALQPSNSRHPVQQCQTLSMGLSVPIHTKRFYTAAFKEIDISLFRISVTRLIGNAAKAEEKAWGLRLLLLKACGCFQSFLKWL